MPTIGSNIRILGAILAMNLVFQMAPPALAQSQPSAEEDTTETPDGVTAQTIVAVVDEKPVLLGELIALRQTLPQAYQRLPDEVLMTALIQMVVEKQALANAAQAAGLHNETHAIYALQNSRRSVLADLYLNHATRIGLGDDAVDLAYAEQYQNAPAAIQVRAAHVLVEDEATGTEIRTKLDDGADFGALAAEYGTDMTSARGGDLGWQTMGELLPAFARVIADMEPGQILGPVKSPFGWHLIRLDDRRDKPVPPLDQVRAQLKKDLAAKIKADVVEKIRSSSSVTRLKSAAPADQIRNDSLIQQ